MAGHYTLGHIYMAWKYGTLPSPGGGARNLFDEIKIIKYDDK
jgi:hypothetical protein